MKSSSQNHITKSHAHKIISSQKHILSKSYPHKIISSQNHILTKSYPHKIISSQNHIPTKSYPHKIISPQNHILTKSYPHKIISSQHHKTTKSHPQCPPHSPRTPLRFGSSISSFSSELTIIISVSFGNHRRYVVHSLRKIILTKSDHHAFFAGITLYHHDLSRSLL
jgi:hypothetical protein